MGKSSAAKEETFKLERKFNFSLECPDITDNFYLSILDWSKNGIFCVGVNGKCYLMLKQK